MKVRMLTGLQGAGVSLEPGDIHDFEDAEATRLISARYALPYVEDQTERAVLPAPAEHRGKGRKPKP